MTTLRNMAALVLALLLAACSPQGLIDAAVPDQDKAFALGFVEDLKTGDSAALQQVLHPDVWAQVAAGIPSAPAMFPEGGQDTIVSFNIQSSTVNGASESSKQITVVTEGQGRWVVTDIVASQQNDAPLLVTSFSAQPTTEEPDVLATMRTVGQFGTIAAIVGLAILALVVGLVVFLIVRSRRKRTML